VKISISDPIRGMVGTNHSKSSMSRLP